MIEDILPLLVLIAMNGLFSCIEAAILGLNPNKIKMQAESGEQRSTVLLQYLDNTTKYLSLAQIGMSFSGILAGAYGAYAFMTVLFEKLYQINTAVPQQIISIGAMVILTVILTFFVTIFGKFIPRRIGRRNAESFVYLTIGFMKLFGMITTPFVLLCTVISNFVLKIIGISSYKLDEDITEQEIRMLVDAGGDSGSIDESEKEMINNIFEFDNTSAGEIATHRTDIVAVPVTATLGDVMEVINNKKYSRIPVYRENIDDIIGIFHVKDIIKYVFNDSTHLTESGFHLEDILMQPYFVPFSKKTDELFEQMQLNKIHMAIIIDEYGGTAGLVTMEDLLEEIVGNIFDEYDEEEEEEIRSVGEDIFELKGTTQLEDVKELLRIEFSLEDLEDYDTIGGFLIGQLGRIPEEQEQPEISFEGYTFQILKIEEKRIETVRVEKLGI